MGQICKEAGCKKREVIKGFCTEHAKQRGFRELVDAKNKKNREIKKPIPADEFSESIDDSGWKQQTIAAALTDHERHVINLIDLFRSKQQAELEAFTSRLNDIDEPYDRLMFVYQAVQI